MKKRAAKPLNPNVVTVMSIVAEALLIDDLEVTPKSKVMEDLGADSIDVVQIAMDLEEKFCISIDEVDADRCETVEDLVRMVERKLETSAVPA